MSLRRCSKLALLLAAALLAAACSTARVAATDKAAPAQMAAVAGGADASAPVAPAPPVQPPPPPRATADFARAVELMRAGKDDEAQIEFQQISSGYPAYAGALVNLGILYRKHGDLAKSDQALHAAVQRDANNAEGWCELGVTLRMEGKFHDAADAYTRAITVKPDFAAAYRNLAIVLDLYLGDTAASLTAMQRYQELAADDKAVAGWIADLKQRAGKNAAPPVADKAGGQS